jgi:hypothetical protein
MSGLIAVPCRQDQARYIDFHRTLNALERPEGTVLEFYPGFFPDYNINNAVDKVIKDKMEWLFIIDDDMIVPPHTLNQLLERNEDIIGVNLLNRTDPFNPYIFHSTLEHGEAHPDVLEGKRGVIECAACGTGGMLIRRRVLEHFAHENIKPFTHNDTLKTYDLYFCFMARKLGYGIFVDTSAVCGHIIQAVIWPNKINGEWKTTVVLNGTAKLDIPAAKRYPDGTIKI